MPFGAKLTGLPVLGEPESEEAVVGMVLIVLPPALVYLFVCLPAYFLSRRNGEETILLPVAWLPSAIIWGSLTAAGIGPQGLANVIELFWLAGGGIVLTYAKVLTVDRAFRRPGLTTLALTGVLMVAAVVLRLKMPMIPE